MLAKPKPSCARVLAHTRVGVRPLRLFATGHELHLLTVSVATVLVPHITVTLIAVALFGIDVLTSHQLPGLT